MIYFKLVNSAFLRETKEVAFYHAGSPLPEDRWAPEPGVGAMLRICANDRQLRSLNAVEEGEALVLFQNILGVAQTVTHVVRCIDAKDAAPTSEWAGWPHERRFIVLARLDWHRFGGAAVGPHGDRLASHAPLAVAMRQGPVKLRHLLGLADNPIIQRGHVWSTAANRTIGAEDVLREVRPEHGFDLVEDFAANVRAAE